MNIGPLADVQSIAAVIDDLGAVCAFGSELQRAANRNRAVREVSRSLGLLPRIGEEPFPTSPFGHVQIGGYYPSIGVPIVSPRFERAVADAARQSEPDTVVRVERLLYQNPVELIIIASGAVVLATIKLIRDWPARRQLNEAEAADYQNTVRAREQARQIVLDHLANGEYVLARDQVDGLMTPRIADAMRSLGDANLTVDQL